MKELSIRKTNRIYKSNIRATKNKSIYIIVNLDSFLSEEELVELEKFLLYNDIKVLALQTQ